MRDLILRLRSQAGAIKLKQDVRQIDHHPALGFAGVQFLPLQFFQEGAVAGDLPALLFDQLVLRVKSLIPRVELMPYSIAAHGTEAAADGRARQRLPPMAADNRPTSGTQQTAQDSAGCGFAQTEGDPITRWGLRGG